MNRIAGRAWITLLLVALLLAGFVFFLCEYIAQAGQWAVFEGSPHIYSGSNLDCGVITDREGILLLEMEQKRLYSADATLRMATVHWLGDHYGNIDSPAISYHAEALVGYDLLNGVYNYGSDRGVTELTLSAKVQKAALEALGEYKGTIAVYNYKTGQLLCAVSTPTYDPDNVPDLEADTEGALDGMYVNRFTQSNYIPGSIFKIVTLAAALETIPDIQEQEFVCTGSYTIGDHKVICDDTHWEQDLKMAFRNSCNCAFAQIAQQLGGETLTRYVEQYGVIKPITFDGITTATGNYEAIGAMEFDMAWSAIGQYNDQVNPCAFLTFVGAVANGGKGVMPYVVEHISVDGSSTYKAKTVAGERIMTAGVARILQEFMAFNVEDKYGSENFPGLTVCAKTGTAEVGGDKKPNAMLAGFVSNDEYPLAFIVCAEDSGYGKTICIPMISKVLAACKEVMDSE